MTSHPRQLAIPGVAFRDPKAVELLRLWAANGQQHVALATGVWDDPASWGIMLVDLAKHIANAYEQTNGSNRDEVLARLKEGFDAEWSFKTDVPKSERETGRQ